MMRLSEITKATHGRLIGQDVEVTSVGTDSRNIEQNQLFVAIKGENFDGNKFAEEAMKQGAAAALISDQTSKASPAVLVNDTRHALGDTAKHWRSKFEIPLIAVTGSNGKTTVKEMLTSILTAANHRVLSTTGNLNNDIGMPLTLLKIRKEHSAAVIEMGMNHEGEIRYLAQIAQPTVAIVNNAGTAHIGELGSREAIARAKGEIYEGLQSNGVALINADDVFADYWRGLNTQRKIVSFGLYQKADVMGCHSQQGELTHISLKTPDGDTEFTLAMPGEHNVRNAVAAAAVAYVLGISAHHIAEGLQGFGGVKGRLQRMQGMRDAVLIDDTYNANPDSMKAALDVLAGQAGTKIFIMGDMAELGEDAAEMHTEIGTYAKARGVDKLLALGENSAHSARAFGANATHFGSLEDLLNKAFGLMQKNTTVLVKGSRFMQMERVVNQLKEQKNEREKQPCC